MNEVASMTVENVTTAFGSLTEFAGEVMTMIAGNPVLMICFSAGLLGTAIGVVRKLKRV